MQEGIHVFFSGVVQGVGFRFTARMLASKYKIKGWVMNLSDGRVELAAEGNSEELDSFLEDLQKALKNYIIDYQLEKVSFSGNYKDFQIKFPC